MPSTLNEPDAAKCVHSEMVCILSCALRVKMKTKSPELCAEVAVGGEWTPCTRPVCLGA